VTRPQFAIVREDPEVEAALLDGVGAALVVASGGCTALTLARRFPHLSVTAFDINPAQIAHCREKAAETEARRLDVLDQRGAFEGLFRILRGVITEFVAPPEELEAFFAGDAGLAARWFAHQYWPTAFALAFSDPLLHTMFGPDATQHAVPGSYPAYFQRAFERGLARADAARNPFLQHVFLQRHVEPPEYLGRPGDVEWLLGDLLAVPSLDRFGLISLSNVFDWSGDDLVERWATHLGEVRPGGVVVMRQLNNGRDLRRFFAPAFTFDDALGAELLARDRSLFYERIEVARRAS
jgi:S-adenosylmethionine-diacylglycerol 3-amino-3-carboxypropyl transferase